MDAEGAIPDLPRGLMEFSVRRLQRGDAERLLEFYESLSAHSTYFFEPNREISLPVMRITIDRTLEGRDLGLIATDRGGRVIAHFFFWDIALEAPHLGLGLRDEYQDFGLGKVFLVYLIGLGKHVLKKQAIGLTVMKENQRALALYHRFGFRIVRDVTFRTPDDSYEMRLDFTASPEAVQ